MASILVTGADGFIGRALCEKLKKQGENVRCAVRSMDSSFAGARHGEKDLLRDFDKIAIGDIGPDTDWAKALEGVEIVVHLAGRAHIMKETSRYPLNEYRHVNVLGTECLARMAVEAGVRRMVFVSSIGVNGRETTGRPFTEENSVNPEDLYAVSKWEAECVIRDIAANKTLEIVIVRPPLVYGPWVPGNFFRLLNWVNKGIPLPFSGIDNRRSMIAVENLADILALCARHPNAAGETFLVSDGEDLSTPDIIRKLAKALGCKSRLFPFPKVLSFVVKLLGKEKDYKRLFSSLVVDSSKARDWLGWNQPVSVEEGLQRTANWFLNYYKGK